MRMRLDLSLLLCWALVHVACSARILAWFPFAAKSHQIAIQPIVYELAKRGHQIDFYCALKMMTPHENIKENILPDFNELMHKKQAASNQQGFDPKLFGALPVPVIQYFLYLMNEMANEELKNTPAFIDLLKSNKKYDLVMGEFYFSNEDALALVHKFDAPGVVIHAMGDSAWLDELSGLPDNPAYMIDFKSLEVPGEMTFFGRLYNFYVTLATNLVSYFVVGIKWQWMTEDIYKYPESETRPRNTMQASDVALILTNSHHSVGYPSPKAPHVKEVGGINLQQTIKPLPKDLQDFMDSAKDGVIYFSLGSVVDMKQMMNDGGFDAFLNAFKRLKQKVLWRWKNEEDFPKIDYPNIKFSTWFPQQDILANNKTVIFVTHGGIMSTTEAVNYGVPLVGLAVFGDQPKNVKQMATAGYGVPLYLSDLTEQSVSEAINEVLNNYPKYKNEVLRRQAMFRDRPMKPVEEAAYWVEYVLRHGKVLQPRSAQMPFYQLYLLDVFGFIIGSAALGLWLLKKLLCSACSLIRKKKPVKVSDEKKRR